MQDAVESRGLLEVQHVGRVLEDLELADEDFEVVAEIATEMRVAVEAFSSND